MEVTKKTLMDISKFEWGFRMMAILKADEKLPWLQHVRAVGIYVPTPYKDMAINIIGEAFEPSFDSKINIPDFTDKFLYMEPNQT